MFAGLALAKVADNANYPLGSMTIPQFGRSGRMPRARHDFSERIEDTSLIRSNHDIGALRDSHRSFSIVPKREAGNSKNRGFLLKSSRIGQDDSCSGFQVQKLQVTERVHSLNSVH